MRLHIKNGFLIDPKNKRDGRFDLVICDGCVEDVLPPGQKVAEADIIDVSGLIVSPGFIDLHTHLREPGFEYKETIQTGTRAAAAGGFTSVCCMANTYPVNDNASVTQDILKIAQESGCVNVYPIGAVTVGLKGERLTPMGELKEAGCVALSDDGQTIANSQVMRLAMEYAKSFSLPIISHAIDPVLAGEGVMNEGLTSTRLGLLGIPHAAEDMMIARDIYLAKLTGASLHIAHLSTREGVNLIKRAKEEGVAVTAEVTPHHLTLTDQAVGDYNTSAKMAPPLRNSEDQEALIEGVKSGIIDAIATDHAPHGVMDKEIEFDQAASGVIGLETALSILLQLFENKSLSINRIIELLTVNPARIAGLKRGSLEKGAMADLVIFNPKEEWEIDPSKFYSKSRNSPFTGMKVRGVVTHTFVSGKRVL